MSGLGLSILALVAVLATHVQGSANTSSILVSPPNVVKGNDGLISMAPLAVWTIPDEYTTIVKDVAGGFLGELLSQIANITQFQFKIEMHPELRYDSPNADGSWTGTLIGAVSQENPIADLVGPDVTSTSAGRKVVDFLEPIQTYNLQIAVNKKFGLTDSVQYVAIDDSDLYMLNTSANATLNKIWNNVQKGRPDSLVDSDEAGLAKVLTGNFAFLAESIYYDRMLKFSPGAVLAGGNLGSLRKMGFAVRKGSPLQLPLNKALIQLKTTGVLDALIAKYSP